MSTLKFPDNLPDELQNHHKYAHVLHCINRDGDWSAWWSAASAVKSWLSRVDIKRENWDFATTLPPKRPLQLIDELVEAAATCKLTADFKDDFKVSKTYSICKVAREYVSDAPADMNSIKLGWDLYGWERLCIAYCAAIAEEAAKLHELSKTTKNKELVEAITNFTFLCCQLPMRTWNI